MICDDVIYLIKDDPTPGGIFDRRRILDRRQRIERRVFCTVKSVSSAEYYRAHAAGLSPDIIFVLSDLIDYDGETLLRHGEGEHAKYYTVLRTFANGRRLEITAEIAKAYDLQQSSESEIVGVEEVEKA